MFKKLKLYKDIVIEILETLCTICLYIEWDCRFSHNRQYEYGRYMRGHFNQLKEYSLELRKDKK